MVWDWGSLTSKMALPGSTASPVTWIKNELSGCFRVKWWPANTAVRFSARREHWRCLLWAQTTKASKQMMRRMHWKSSWERWSWSLHRPNCSLWKPSAKFRYVESKYSRVVTLTSCSVQDYFESYKKLFQKGAHTCMPVYLNFQEKKLS